MRSIIGSCRWILVAVACGAFLTAGEVRAQLREVLEATLARHPELAVPLHPSDYRLVGERIASHELVDHPRIQKFTGSYLQQHGKFLAERMHRYAIHIDEGQPGLAEVHQEFKDCLPLFGIAPDKILLYLYQNAGISFFSWDVQGAAGPSILGIGTRVVADLSDAFPDARLRKAAYAYVISRELSRIASGEGALNAITLVIASVQSNINSQIETQVTGILWRTGLPSLLVPALQNIARSVRDTLVPLVFRRFNVWNVNSAVSSNRAAFLAVAQRYDLATAITVSRWVSMYQILNDYRLVERIDVDQYIAQLQESVVLTPLTLTVKSGGSSGDHSDYGGEIKVGFWDQFKQWLLRNVGVPELPTPVAYNGQILILADLSRFPESPEYKQLVEAWQSQDTYLQSLQMLARLASIDQIRELRFPDPAKGETSEIHQVVDEMANHLLEDMSRASEFEGSRAAAELKRVAGLSYSMQAMALWVLESLQVKMLYGNDPFLAPFEAEMLEALWANAERNTGYLNDAQDFIQSLKGGRKLDEVYFGPFGKRHEVLLKSITSLLVRSGRRQGIGEWLVAKYTPASEDVRSKLIKPLIEVLRKTLERSGDDTALQSFEEAVESLESIQPAATAVMSVTAATTSPVPR